MNFKIIFLLLAGRKAAKSFRLKVPHMSSEDKMELYQIISAYRHIIDNKKTDLVSTGVKNDAWKKITAEYNSLGKFQRTVEQLKTCFRNAAHNMKKDLAADRAEQFRTGGGTPLLRVLEDHPLLPMVMPSVTPLINRHDSSAVYLQDLVRLL